MNKMRTFHYDEIKHGKIKNIETHIYPTEKLNYHFVQFLNAKTGEIFYAYLAKVKVIKKEKEQIFFVDYEGKKWLEEWSDIINIW